MVARELTTVGFVAVEPRNVAVERLRSITSRWTDWETLNVEWEGWYTEDFVREDRRRLINMPLADRATYLEHSRVWFELADGRPTFSVEHVVAIRGERLVAWTIEASYESAPSVRAVIVTQFDSAVLRVERQVHFDLEDVDAALAELDSMYAALDEGEQTTPVS